MLKTLLISLFTLTVGIGNANALQTNADSEALAKILAAQPEDAQARYIYRRPQDTLEFFGIRPGMTIGEALPSGGWYTKILAPYLGSEGHLKGLDYSIDLWPRFSFTTEESLAAKKTWTTDWVKGTEEWRAEGDASVSAAVFGNVPADAAGTLDAVLFIRALHNMARFSDDNKDFLGEALSDTYKLLKPGGVVGLVQHEAREDRPDSWATGANGYLKKSFVIEHMKKAGLEFIAESAINENEKDQAGEGDIVWRLQPSYATSRDNPELKEKIKAIGESHRMTLLFRKPLPQ